MDQSRRKWLAWGRTSLHVRLFHRISLVLLSIFTFCLIYTKRDSRITVFLMIYLHCKQPGGQMSAMMRRYTWKGVPWAGESRRRDTIAWFSHGFPSKPHTVRSTVNQNPTSVCCFCWPVTTSAVLTFNILGCHGCQQTVKHTEPTGLWCRRRNDGLVAIRDVAERELTSARFTYPLICRWMEFTSF